MAVTNAAAAIEPVTQTRRIGSRSRLLVVLGNWKLIAGVAFVAFLALFSIVGRFLVDYDQTQVASDMLNLTPSLAYPLGTDNVGRNMFAMMVYGIPPSLEVGVITAIVSTFVGTFLGLTAGFARGPLDAIVRSLADVTLTIPSLLLLVVIASYLRTTSIELTALIIAIFAWAGPTRAIRAQTLSMRERGFVEVAKLSGRSNLKIIILEIMPNLMPYIAAGLVTSVAGGVLALVGIQLLGLGPLYTPNLGMILETAQFGSALYKGMWWWWGPPLVSLMILFVGLFFISQALDEYANPRLRQKAG